MGELLTTDRLVLREWTLDDAEDALAIYGDAEIARWLTPALTRVPDEAEMRSVLSEWLDDRTVQIPPYGHWALVRQDDGRLIGGISLRPLPPYKEDIEVSWQLARDCWGHGYATEAARALAGWAFSQGAEELIAVVRPRNLRAAAMARRLGMEWTGETDKYYGMRLN